MKKPMKIGVGKKKKPAPKEERKFPMMDKESKRHEKMESSSKEKSEGMC